MRALQTSGGSATPLRLHMGMCVGSYATYVCQEGRWAMPNGTRKSI